MTYKIGSKSGYKIGSKPDYKIGMKPDYKYQRLNRKKKENTKITE